MNGNIYKVTLNGNTHKIYTDSHMLKVYDEVDVQTLCEILHMMSAMGHEVPSGKLKGYYG
jgi:hypothetical protein